MTFEEYHRKTRQLSEIKSSLYDLASHKLNKGDKTGAQVTYAEIDAIDVEIDALMKANEETPATSEELTLKFDS